MLGRSNDLPLDKDAAGRFLPWIIAFMVYLGMLALAAALLVGSLTRSWDAQAAGTLTVQIPAPTDQASPDMAAATMNRNIDRALAILKATPEVVSASPLNLGEIETLLAPWLGSGSLATELPLPRLIDVAVSRPGAVDIASLATALAAAVPGATVEDHRLWLGDLMLFARSLEVLAVLVVLLVAAAAVATVVYATRAGFAIQQDSVELLHQIGAQDSYIAGQFQRHALKMGAKGALCGIALAAVTFAGLAALAGQIDTALLPAFSPGILDVVLVLAVPVGGALLTMYTARTVVLRSLERLP